MICSDVSCAVRTVIKDLGQRQLLAKTLKHLAKR